MDISLKKIDHIGIAVEDIDEALKLYRDILKMEFIGIEEIPDQKVRTAFIKIGEVNIEFLEPTAPDSPVQKFLDSGRKGIHHLAFEVSDIQTALIEMESLGIQLIDKQPRIGAHNKKIAFLHPKAASGVLVELCQSTEERP